MKQQTFSDIEYSNRKKKTKRGRPPRDIEVMLRMYLMQNWFNLSDADIEDEYTTVMRESTGISKLKKVNHLSVQR